MSNREGESEVAITIESASLEQTFREIYCNTFLRMKTREMDEEQLEKFTPWGVRWDEEANKIHEKRSSMRRSDIGNKSSLVFSV